jgi:phosphoserine phosphatase
MSTMLLLLLLSGSVVADFGDYADTTISCPVLATCPVVCIDQLSNCPSDMRACPQDNTSLCIDGSCRETCPDDVRNPCPSCTPFACPKRNNYIDTCLDAYEGYYMNMEHCESQLETAKRFNAKPFSLLSVWLIVIILMTIMCSRRNRFAEVKDLEEGYTQTGYTSTLLDRLGFYLVVLTLTCFQLTLMGAAIASYKENEKRALRAFEATWMIGAAFCFFYKWPYSIASVFYRTCPLHQANHVCIIAKHKDLRTVATHQDPVYIRTVRRLLYSLSYGFNATMAFLFGMPQRGKFTYVPVLEDTRHGTRYFVFQFRRYNYDAEQEAFVPGHLSVVRTIGDALDAGSGLSSEEVQRRLRTVGPNAIEMKRPSFFSSLMQEFSKTFYTYQLFMMWTWIPLYYYIMAIVHSSVIVTGGVCVAWFKYCNDSQLYRLTLVDGHVDVLRDGTWTNLPEYDIVPGDLVMVRPGRVTSDLILVQSEGILVDEAALTGESTPMAKTAVDPANRTKTWDPVLHKKHIIAAGTTVLESEWDNNWAVVVATGSYTSKGELLRDVFAYERHQFKFDVEVGLVIVILVIEAIIGMAIVTAILKEDPVYGWFYGMYVVSVVLPPLLPTVFTVSVGISDNRLAKKRIACSNSEDILVAGKVTRAFFDKTGTLTRQGLDFISAKCIHTWSQESMDMSKDLQLGMSCCHGLTTSQAGEKIGNPVDRIMFEASGASLSETRGERVVTDSDGEVVEVVKHFDFDHHRMTQSVVVKKSDGTLLAYVKGSGESIKLLCRAETLPADYDQVVRSNAKAGVYQISMGSKILSSAVSVQDLSRDDVETSLSFVGVINFKNVLRDETPDVIRQLEAGEVRCVMVTGDSMLTGIRIAKEAGILHEGSRIVHCDDVAGGDVSKLVWLDEEDRAVTLPPADQLSSSGLELAVSGSVWELLRSSSGSDALLYAQVIRVYGRCTPHHKVSVVSTFVEQGKITLMCG